MSRKVDPNEIAKQTSPYIPGDLPNDRRAGSVLNGPGFKLSPQELKDKIDEYFEKGTGTRTVFLGPANNRVAKEVKVATITGLILYCGYADRNSFYDLAKVPEYSPIIRWARTRIEQIYEEGLQIGNNTVGSIFALKNMGWHDTQTQVLTDEQPKDELGDTERAARIAALFERARARRIEQTGDGGDANMDAPSGSPN